MFGLLWKTFLLTLLCVINVTIAFPGASLFDEGEASRSKRQTSDDDRIVNGTEPVKHLYPFIVVFQALKNSVWTKVCHGVLITPQTVLTSANCNLTTDARALAGQHDLNKLERTRQTRGVCQIDTHPEKEEFKNNIMIVHLSDPFVLNNYVNIIRLPTVKDLSNLNNCMIAGWGFNTVIGTPKHKPIQFQTCRQERFSDHSVFCGSPGVCSNFGSPLVCASGNREFAAGLYAWSLPKCAIDGTSDQGFVSLVALDHKWLYGQIKDAESKCGSWQVSFP